MTPEMGYCVSSMREGNVLSWDFAERKHHFNLRHTIHYHDMESLTIRETWQKHVWYSFSTDGLSHVEHVVRKI